MGTKDIPNIGHQKVGTSQTAKRIVNQSKEFRHGTSLVVPWLRLRLQVVCLLGNHDSSFSVCVGFFLAALDLCCCVGFL